MNTGLAIIGAGKVGTIHAQAAQEAGNTPAVICDLDIERARQLAQETGGERTAAVSSPDAVWHDENVDAIVIAVPTAQHEPMTHRALDAGTAVLLEKPMALNLEQCDAIVEAAEQHDPPVQLAFVCRYAPVALQAKKIIESGALGEIYHAKASLYRQRGIPGLGGWFTTKAESGGGVLADLGVHLIDLVMHLIDRRDVSAVNASCVSRFGSPMESYCYEEMWGGPPNFNGVFDVEDGATGMIRFGSNATLELNVMWASNLPAGILPDGIAILGDRGGLWLELWTNRLILTTQRDGQVRDETQQVDSTNAWDEAWQRQHEVFADVAAHRAAPTATVQHGRAVQAVIEAMYESSESSCEVAVDVHEPMTRRA